MEGEISRRIYGPSVAINPATIKRFSEKPEIIDLSECVYDPVRHTTVKYSSSEYAEVPEEPQDYRNWISEDEPKPQQYDGLTDSLESFKQYAEQFK